MPGFLIDGRNYQGEVSEPLMASSTFRFLNLDGREIDSPPTSKLLVLSLAFTQRFQLLDVISNHSGAAADPFLLFYQRA